MAGPIDRTRPDHRLEQAHKYCGWHREEILASDECGCFYCMELFRPDEINEWVDDGQTAMCPRCGIDSVLGSRSGFPLDRPFLEEMNRYWFGRVARVLDWPSNEPA